VGERTSYAPGTFSWVELSTTDPEGAKAFYARLFGWEGEDTPAGENGTYTMIRLRGHDIAGIQELRRELGDQGVPPHWLSYITVDDVDRAAIRAGELAGQVVAGPFDVEDAGRMAVIRDPLGATFAVWQPYSRPGAGLVNEPGTMCWNDLVTSDAETSARYYRELFGWRIEPIADGAYWTIYNGDSTNGGLLPLEGMPQVWNAYLATDDLDATLATVEEAGGEVRIPRRTVPAGRFAVVSDPQGAAFSLFEGELDP
jgi:uncharacterized protein